MDWEDFSDRMNNLLKENKIWKALFSVILIPVFVMVILIDLLREDKDGL